MILTRRLLRENVVTRRPAVVQVDEDMPNVSRPRLEGG